MICKIFLVVLLSAVVVQSYVPYTTKEDFHLAELDVQDVELAMSLAELQTKVKNFIDSSVKKIQNAINEAGSWIKSFVTQEENSFAKDFKKLQSQLSSLKSEAKALKVDVKACLKDKEENLKKLPATAGKKFVECGKQKYEDAKTRWSGYIDKVKQNWEQVKALSKEWKNCKGVVCKTGLAARITGAGTSIPANIAKLVTSVINKITSFKKDIRKCTGQAAKAFLKAGKKILLYVEKCAREKENRRKLL